jgi:hypothetical protein
MFPKFTLAETYLQIWRYTIFWSEYQCKLRQKIEEYKKALSLLENTFFMKKTNTWNNEKLSQISYVSVNDI